MLPILLFFHILGVALLFSGNTIAVIAHAQLRRAATLTAVRAATTNFSLIGPLMGAGAFLVIVLGIAMVYVGGFGWSFAWVDVALIVAIVLAVNGPVVSGGRGDALRAAAAKAGDGPITSELRARIHDRIWNYSTFLTTFELVALLFIMTVKPDLIECIFAVALAAVAAAIPTLLDRRAFEPDKFSSPGR